MGRFRVGGGGGEEEGLGSRTIADAAIDDAGFVP